MPDLTGNTQYDAITAAIKAFKFWNYGLDDTDPNSEYAEWVPDLAGAIHKAVGEQQPPATAAAMVPVIRAALEELPEVCRYHGAELEPTGDSWMSRRESCCDTGLPAMRRRQAMDALARIEAAL